MTKLTNIEAAKIAIKKTQQKEKDPEIGQRIIVTKINLQGYEDTEASIKKGDRGIITGINNSRLFQVKMDISKNNRKNISIHANWIDEKTYLLWKEQIKII